MIEQFWRKYTCDCKSYIASGWVCSDVLAAAAINKHINLDEIRAGIPHRRRPGRPREELSCLIRDNVGATDDDNAVVSGPAGRLKRQLTKYPTEAIGYKALHRFATSEADAPEQSQLSYFCGMVTSVQAEEDPITWNISFSDGNTHDVTIDEIVADLTMATSRLI